MQWRIQGVAMVSAETPTERARALNQRRLVSRKAKNYPEVWLVSGAVLGGFLRFPETTQDFPSTMGAALFGYKVSRGIHSGLNSGVNWPLFHLLVKEMQ